MISIEIILVIAFTLMGALMYTMYRYFDDMIKEMRCCFEKDISETADALSLCWQAKYNKIDLLEQKTKDGIQSNAMCCKMAIEKINKRMETLEASYKESIHIVYQNKGKTNATKRPTTKQAAPKS